VFKFEEARIVLCFVKLKNDQMYHIEVFLFKSNLKYISKCVITHFQVTSLNIRFTEKIRNYQERSEVQSRGKKRCFGRVERPQAKGLLSLHFFICAEASRRPVTLTTSQESSAFRHNSENPCTLI